MSWGTGEGLSRVGFKGTNYALLLNMFLSERNGFLVVKCFHPHIHDTMPKPQGTGSKQSSSNRHCSVCALSIYIHIYAYVCKHMYTHTYITKTHTKVSACKEHPICLKHFLKSNRSSLLLSNTFINFLVHSWDTLARSYF